LGRLSAQQYAIFCLGGRAQRLRLRAAASAGRLFSAARTKLHEAQQSARILAPRAVAALNAIDLIIKCAAHDCHSPDITTDRAEGHARR
jgi:hypothetical protein